MNFRYKNLDIHYDVFGQGKRLILLHGWGGPAVWDNYIRDFVAMGLQVFVLALPGFGESDTPEQAIDSYFYADLVNSFLVELEIEKPIILGHSMGGKVAAIFQSKYKLASKIILVDSAGYKRFYIGVLLKVVLAKTGKFLFGLLGKFGRDALRRRSFLSILGSIDYLQSGDMKDSFRKIIGEDIRELLSSINIPTLIVWGDRDQQTPLIDAVEMNRAIKGSQLKIIKDGSHFPFVSHPDVFFKLVRNFIEPE